MTFRERLKGLGFDSYADYLQSEHWYDFKVEYRRSKNPQRCMVCFSKNVELHHITYVRIGNEKLTDVLPLCGTHHGEVHKLLKEGKRPVEATEWAISKMRPKTISRPIVKAIVPNKKKSKPPLKKCLKCGGMFRRGPGPNCRGCVRGEQREINRERQRQRNARFAASLPERKKSGVDPASLALLNAQRMVAGLKPLRPEETGRLKQPVSISLAVKPKPVKVKKKKVKTRFQLHKIKRNGPAFREALRIAKLVPGSP